MLIHLFIYSFMNQMSYDKSWLTCRSSIVLTQMDLPLVPSNGSR